MPKKKKKVFSALELQMLLDDREQEATLRITVHNQDLWSDPVS